ncbi:MULTISPECIES: FkbM family methyltransferase [Halorussus]|uniref:FkbM family methyltransferase n=1 Tax=Halorussus TaxID=1070314 RepID=UPI00209D511C|nr:FkbM family methyltransferase [Halorussus vallis]USZ76650.1 FkbM family methyltransferase [Halorussus vallis]
MLDATEEPAPRTRVLNGVAVPGTEFDEANDYHPDHENTVVAALRRRVRRGDRVVVVGGGWGTTTVVAARMTHFEGDVTTFEPSSKMLETIRRTIRANRVGDVVTVEHAAVGSVSDTSERIFGSADGEALPPEELPECDVLDLDCEGAELEILRGIRFRPRLVTVEVHPHLGCSHDEVESELTDLGYDVLEKEPIRPGDDIVNYVAVRGDERP